MTHRSIEWVIIVALSLQLLLLFIELLFVYNQVIVYRCNVTPFGVYSHFLEKSPTLGVRSKYSRYKRCCVTPSFEMAPYRARVHL